MRNPQSQTDFPEGDGVDTSPSRAGISDRPGGEFPGQKWFHRGVRHSWTQGHRKRDGL
jgi:hypothetical protein